MRTNRKIVGTLACAAVALASSRAGAEVPALDGPEREAAPAPEVVAEALYLADALPAGGRDLNVSLVLAEGEPDPVTERAALTLSPRVQLAMPFAEGRLGFTADVGIDAAGGVLEAPGASLKLLLRSPEGGRTGFAASLDLLGSTHSLSETETGAGLNAIRAVGPVTLRACAGFATGVRSWSPHLHAGVSGAVAFGSRWRVLAEAVTQVGEGEAAISAGPTVKVAVGDGAAVMAGALFPLSQAGSAPVLTLQLTKSL